ncbi:MAG: trimethylamine methyltransferase family protein [Pseudomonadota bacterium]
MSTQTARRAGRSGGRAARQALRAAPLAEDIRPVRAGMDGGTYKPLSDAGVERIHQGALDALEQIGVALAPQSGIDAMTAAGADLGDDGRIRFPRALVEDMLDKAAKKVTLYSRDGKNDLELWGNRVHYGTAGAAVHMVDVQTNEYRDSTIQDLYDASRISDQLDNIHFVQRPLVARDITDNLEMDYNTIYACCSGTTKHVGTSFTEPSHMEECLELIHMIAGGEENFRVRPFISNTNCFVVPPMKFATESCEVMEICIRAGMPILLLSAGQAGATAPAPIAGAIVQAVAECLAGMIYVNSIVPGAPAIFGTWPFVSDLRTGAMSGGSGEQALLSAGCAQMHKFYGLPGGAAAGFADAKTPDFQAGYEQATSNVMAGLAGLNMVYEAAGMHASLLGFCFESLILGDDAIGQALRCVRGIEVSEDSVSLDVIRSVCLEGPGHFLGSEQTLGLMQTEYIYPRLGDRSSPKEWKENGKPDLIENAIKLKNEILSQTSKAALNPNLDQAIRERFNIHLRA